MKVLLELVKSGIVVFVLLTGLAGYSLSHPVDQVWNIWHLLGTLLALMSLSAGSFALNQAQEWKIDAKMPRTLKRPIPSGKIAPSTAIVIGLTLVLLGTGVAFSINALVGWLGIATVILYNVFYTLLWKPKWAFGAVPGAIPGAMPVLIGYAANTSDLLKPDLLYAFMLVFLWQMPHFWALALRFRKDYALGGIPVLPVKLGERSTLYHIGLYLFAYVALAVASPWFIAAHWAYALLVIPFAFKVMFEFFKFNRVGENPKWLPFFLWTTFSVLIFLLAPVVDKWQLALSSF